MKYEVKDEHIYFQYPKGVLSTEIKSILSFSNAYLNTQDKSIKISHKEIANLNVHQIEKLGLPNVYAHRLNIKTKGSPTTSAFTIYYEFINRNSRKFYQIEKHGVILKLDGQLFTLTNPHFNTLENLQKMKNPELKTGERLELWSQIKKEWPEDIFLENQELLEINFIKADRFCVDQLKTSNRDFKIVPELIYIEDKSTEDENKIENKLPSQLHKKLSQRFQKDFLKQGASPYYKIHNYYVQTSKALQECLKVIEKINLEPLENRQSFYLNPMERIKKELPENISEGLLENVFFETKQFKSNRILHIGVWVPKLKLYIDPNNKNPWFPDDDCDISLKLDNGLYHFSSDDLNKIVVQLEQKKKEGSNYITYKNQKIPINDEVINEIKRVKNIIEKEGKRLGKKLDNKELEKLSKLVAIIKDNIDDKIYESSIRKQKNLQNSIPDCLSDKFNKYTYQKEGLLWLEDHYIQGSPGVLLADDMGLGKTFQTLSFLYWYKQVEKLKKPILIVAPIGLLKNWQDEHDKHLHFIGGLGKPYKAYGEFFRNDRKNKTNNHLIEEMQKSNWILTSYETIRDHHKDFFIKISFSVIVFDEIQKIKNPNSLMTDASKSLDSDFSIGLTGTPIENSFIDLWCISDCLHPKILGLLKNFQNKYIKNETPNTGKEIQNKLNTYNPPFMLRRTKEGVLSELPKKQIYERKGEMTNEQASIYSGILRKAKKKEFVNGLKALQDLRRYSLYVHDCFKGNDEEFINSSIKLKILFEILEEVKEKDEKIIISIQTRRLQKKLCSIFNSKWGLKINIINGEMSGEKRQKSVQDFSAISGFDILIISPKAGGVGLNITSANHIVHLERWWNPAVEDQTTDRIFRIGQTRPVSIYYPLAIHPKYQDESFDIALDNLLKRKRQRQRQTLAITEPKANEINDLYRTVTDGEEFYNTQDQRELFYISEAWLSLKKKIFQKYPAICMKCGNKEKIQVDHIKPRSKYPELELEESNLQILCKTCNLEKSDKDSEKWNFINKK